MFVWFGRLIHIPELHLIAYSTMAPGCQPLRLGYLVKRISVTAQQIACVC